MHATTPQPGSPEPQALPYARKVLVLRTQAARRRRAAWGAGALAVMAAGAGAVGFMHLTGRMPSFATADQAAGPVRRLVLPSKAADLSIILDTDVMPLTPEDARAVNAERPTDVTRVVPARPFRVAAGKDVAPQFGAALRCLAQAVYYEAASEPEDGQRAVAQVVLNRVSHPAFPNTICGVVYQGSERATGCQFTFTCDGSLARVPLPALYRRAERIAREAMAGRVEKQVGNSTNYHADYVVPYWASSLDKLTQIGRHIFYGLRGAIGYRSAFRMPYDVSREIAPGAATLVLPPAPPSAPPDSLAGLPGALPVQGGSRLSEDATTGSLIPGQGAAQAAVPAPSALRADQERGQLVTESSRLRGEHEAEPPRPAHPR